MSNKSINKQRVQTYIDAELQLRELQSELKQLITNFNVSDMEEIKKLDFLADCIIRREEYATNVWNHLTDKQMDMANEVLAKKGF